MNDILPSPSNSETLVINREVLSELIGVEVDKRMSNYGANVQQNISFPVHGEQLDYINIAKGSPNRTFTIIQLLYVNIQ